MQTIANFLHNTALWKKEIKLQLRYET